LDCPEQLGNQGANGHAVNLWMQFVDTNLNIVETLHVFHIICALAIYYRGQQNALDGK
jgi:hypothetical protein